MGFPTFMGYTNPVALHKVKVRDFTTARTVLDKLPYTIKNSKEPQKTLFYNIWSRCHNERNNSFITTIGGTGSGKSYTNIFFGYLLDVDKNGNHLVTPDNIIFDPIKFVDTVANPSHVGQFIMKDEIEMDANSRRSFSKLNQIIGDVMSTVRYNRSMIFLNLPTEQQLDVQVLRLRFGNIDCDKVANDGTHSIFKWEYIQSSKRRDESKYNPPIRRTKLFTFKPINRKGYGVVRSKEEYEFLKLYLPIQKKEFRSLLKDYDKRKDEYLKGKYDEFKSELAKVKEQDKNEEDLLDDYLMAMDKKKDYFIPNGKKPSLARIQKEFGVTLSKAKIISSEFKNTRINVTNRKNKDVSRSEFLEQIKKKRKSVLNK
jgi:hypothetical protein